MKIFKKDIVNFAERSHSNNLFYENARGTTFTVDSTGIVKLLIDEVSYVVLERKDIVKYQNDMIQSHLATFLLNITNEENYAQNVTDLRNLN